MRDDGNCLFRSLSYVVLGVQTYHRTLRNQITHFMCVNESTMCRVDFKPMSDYLKQTKMENCGTWGTEAEIFAFATITNTTVYVYCSCSGRDEDIDGYNWLPYKLVSDGEPEEKA